MKKYLIVFVAFIICIMTVSAFAAENDAISVMYHGKNIRFDTEPYYSNGRIMVPVRAIFEAVGANVSWDDNTNTATAVKGDTQVTMSVGSNIMTINSEAYTMDVCVEIKSDRIYAPARYVAQAFGKQISYHQNSQTAVISDSIEYEYYDNLLKPVPKFDWVENVSFVSSETNDGIVRSYTYKCDENALTDYLNYLQLDFGYTAYDMKYHDGGVTYTYILDKLLIDISESSKGQGFYDVIITPDTQGLYLGNDTGTQTVQDYTDDNKASYSTDVKYEDVDFGRITGASLYETYEQNGDMLYIYYYDMAAVSYYESYIQSMGWVFYDFDIDIDTFSNTKYWVRDNDILCVSVNYFYNLVLVSLVEA